MKAWLRIAALGMIGAWLTGTALADEPVAKKASVAKQENAAQSASAGTNTKKTQKNNSARPARATAPASEGRELGRWNPRPVHDSDRRYAAPLGLCRHGIRGQVWSRTWFADDGQYGLGRGRGSDGLADGLRRLGSAPPHPSGRSGPAQHQFPAAQSPVR